MDKELIREIIASGSAGLSKLAQIAGSTGEHLYIVLVRQQLVDGIASIIAWTTWVAFNTFIAVKIGKWAIKKTKKDTYDDFIDKYAKYCLLEIIILFISFIVWSGLQDAIQHVLNPEFYAIKFIFESIKPK